MQQELTVDAALTGDREIDLQALSLDPMVPTLDATKKLLNDYIEVHKHLLPQFQK